MFGPAGIGVELATELEKREKLGTSEEVIISEELRASEEV